MSTTRGVIARFVPRIPLQRAVRRDKGQKRPPYGEYPPTLAPGIRSGLRLQRGNPGLLSLSSQIAPPHSARAACEGPLRACNPDRGSSVQRFSPMNLPLVPHPGPDSRPFMPFPSHPFEARSTSLLRVEILRWDVNRDCRLVQQRRGSKVNRMKAYAKLFAPTWTAPSEATNAQAS